MSTQMAEHRLHVFATTRAGWWSLALAAMSVVAFVVFFQVVEGGGYGPNFLGIATAIAGAIVAIVGVVWRHERGLLVAIPVLWGVLWAMFLAGELAIPH